MINENKIEKKNKPPLHGKTLSIIVPVYNEEDVLLAFHKRLSSVLDTLPLRNEILYINDGSTDKTLSILQELKKVTPNISIINFSRNFGKEIATTAGLNKVVGDATVIIDADLQDPPELIPEMIKYWQEGYDVVYGKRTSRAGESAFRKLTAFLYYRFIGYVSDISIPVDTGDFRLLNRQAVSSLNKLKEQHRYMKGLFAWIGFSQKEISYDRDSRFKGSTKYHYWKLRNYALDGITSFTTAPLRIASYLGFLIATGGFIYAGFVIINTLIYGSPVKGYPSMMVVVLFLGGVQLMALGVIGEYLGRVFNEVKDRPLYLIDSYIPSNLSQKKVE